MWRASTWALIGAVVGGLAGFAAGGPVMALVLAIAGWALMFSVPLAVAALSGRAAGTLYNPSGASTPRKREYSHAESLVVRGLYEEAVAAFEVAIAEDGSDPTPYLRIARVERDRLGRHEDAARWFKLALERSEPRSGLALLAAKELVELYTLKLSAPARAAPLLARLAEERAGTPEGAWAAEELTRVKEALAEGERG